MQDFDLILNKNGCNKIYNMKVCWGEEKKMIFGKKAEENVDTKAKTEGFISELR